MLLALLSTAPFLLNNSLKGLVVLEHFTFVLHKVHPYLPGVIINEARIVVAFTKENQL